LMLVEAAVVNGEAIHVLSQSEKDAKVKALLKAQLGGETLTPDNIFKYVSAVKRSLYAKFGVDEKIVVAAFGAQELQIHPFVF
jgi:hypothetical protein